jgi:hypothetical protein
MRLAKVFKNSFRSRLGLVAGGWLAAQALVAGTEVGLEGVAAPTVGPRIWPANVIGEDGRRPVAATEQDLAHAVGMISCSRAAEPRASRSLATATLVGSRRTILTAAHVFADEAGPAGRTVRFDPMTDCTFRQYDANGELRAEARFSSVTFGAFRQNAGLPTEDWAVLRTTESLPETSAPLPFAGLRLDELPDPNHVSISVLAFHADRRSRRRTPLLSEGELFAVDYAGFRRLAHTADMGRMSSGAAIVHRTDDGRAIVLGVHRSAATTGNYNLAVPISGSLEATLTAAAFGDIAISGQPMALEQTGGSGIQAAQRWTRDRQPSNF